MGQLVGGVSDSPGPARRRDEGGLVELATCQFFRSGLIDLLRQCSAEAPVPMMPHEVSGLTAKCRTWWHRDRAGLSGTGTGIGAGIAIPNTSILIAKVLCVLRTYNSYVRYGTCNVMSRVSRPPHDCVSVQRSRSVLAPCIMFSYRYTIHVTRKNDKKLCRLPVFLSSCVICCE